MHQGELGPRGLGITFHMIIISILRVTPVANLGLLIVDIMLHYNNVNTQQSGLYNYQLKHSVIVMYAFHSLYFPSLLFPNNSHEITFHSYYYF